MKDKVIALIGAQGMLASMVQEKLPAGYRSVPFDLPDFDITDQGQVKEVLGQLAPNIIINCAAYTNVDGCETEQQLAQQVNGEGPGHLAAVARELGAVLLHISTDFVFAGSKNTAYLEADMTEPVSVYGSSKLQGEQRIVESGLTNFFIIRTSWLYGPGGNNFVETILRLAHDREELKIVSDQVGTPTFTADLTDAIFALLKSGKYGVYHFSNSGQCSWFEFAAEIVNQARGAGIELKLQQLKPIPTEGYPLPAQRPAYSVLSKEKYCSATGLDVPEWKTSLKKYFQLRRVL